MLACGYMKTAEKTCPISRVVGLLGDSCSILILRDLLGKPRRFSELQLSLGASSRTLSIKLKRLEKEGLIVRREFSEMPPRVEYKLTKKGSAFHDVVDAMKSYGKKYL
jgi:DNA-binding HxlR family transcriptional regulator